MHIGQGGLQLGLMGADFAPTLVAVALFIGVGALFSLLLYVSRLPGGRAAAILGGGLLAGLLLGPGGLSQVWPDQGRRIFQGGVETLADLGAMEQRHQTEIAALVESNVSEAAIEEQHTRHAAEIAPLVDAHDAAVESHARTMGALIVGASALAIALGMLASRRTRGAASAVEAVVTGAAVFVFAAVPTALLLMWIMGAHAASAMAIGAAAAGGSIFASMPMRWIGRDARRPIIRATAIVVTAIAGVVISVALPDDRAWVVIIPAASFALGGAIALGAWRARSRRGRWTLRGISRAVVVWLLLPGLVAYTAHGVDPRILLSGWGPPVLALIALLTAGGGQFIGAWLALQTVAPDRVRAKAHFAGTELLAVGVGPTQALLAALLVAGGAIDPSDRVHATGLLMVLISALAIECGVSVNRLAVRRLEEERP